MENWLRKMKQGYKKDTDKLNAKQMKFRELYEQEDDTEEMEDDESKLICPVCKQVISDFEEGETNPCEHVMLTYVDMLGGEFSYVDSSTEAQEIEEEIMSKHEYLEDNGCGQPLNELMKEYAEQNNGYEVIEMTTSGLACGPVSSTEFHLVKVK